MSTLLFLDLLNPCRICNIISAMLLLGLGVTVGGYSGKYLFVSSLDSTLNWSQVLLSDRFWTADVTFWCFGLGTVTIIFTVVYFINVSMSMAWSCCKSSCKCCTLAIAVRLPTSLQRCCCCHCCFELDHHKTEQSTTMDLIEEEFNEINRANSQTRLRV